jgi:hypothetical protein
MKHNKLLVGLAVLFGLLAIIIFTEERQENQTEEIYWKKGFSQIRYFPPTNDWSGYKKEDYIKRPITWKKIERSGLVLAPLFIQEENLPSETGADIPSIYESGFNVKNLYNDLSVLKIRSIPDTDPEHWKEFYIDLEASPKLEMIEKSKMETILLGKEDPDSSRFFFLHNNLLLSTQAYILRRFQTASSTLREKNLVTPGKGFIKRIRIRDEIGFLELENSTTEDKDGEEKSQWRRNSGTRLLLAPNLGEEMESNFKSLRYDLFPDDPSGPGIDVALILTKTNPEITMDLELSDGRQVKILLFPKTQISEKEYRPASRTLNQSIQESPAFIRENLVTKLKQSIAKIREAEPWQRPNQKIQ